MQTQLSTFSGLPQSSTESFGQASQPRGGPLCVDEGVRMKRCPKCKETKPVSMFWKNKTRPDGMCGQCKTCVTAYNQSENHKAATHKHRKSPKGQSSREKYRKSDRGRKADTAYRLRIPEKTSARHAVGNALAAGKLIKKPCEICGTTKDVHAHHDDYARPLEVRWLCRKHHDEHHAACAAVLAQGEHDAEVQQ